MQSHSTRVAIVGGGIGGLVMALQCHQRGIDCMVFEAVEKLEPLGVGINLLPHSVKILASLGLQGDLAATAIETAELAYFNKHGQAIWREPRGLAAGYDFPQFSIHRGELHLLLLRHAMERLGQDRILTGHAIKRFEAGGPASTQLASAVFENRRSGDEVASVTAEMLIAADGIHSTVRATLFPDEGPPRYSGRVLWRGTCIAPPFLTGRSMMQAGHATQKAVIYPISRKVFEETGNNLTNWIMELAVPGDTPPKQDWSKKVDKSVFAGPFAGWKWDWLDVPALIEHGGEAYEYPMCDRDPLPYWSSGRVTLLGDAAHPMYPVGSNGAGQAILDARMLADSLRRAEHPYQALLEYEADRLPKTTEIVTINRKGGPERVIDEVEKLAPAGFTDVERVLSHDERRAIVRGYAGKAGFALAQVNKKAG